MSRSIELRQALQAIFDNLGVRARYQTIGTETLESPYVTYDLASASDDGISPSGSCSD
jgi:hypothetical protein